MTTIATKTVTRIAMWSGPRNISTAMMRSFGNRPDTHVVDEPFYAFYLDQTGYDHPGRPEVLASQPTDWREVARQLAGPLPSGKSVWYQKHMAHHMLESIEHDWMLQPEFQHAFLIRDPARMLLSLSKVLGEFTLEQTGLPQQAAIFRLVQRHHGVVPPVIDSRDVLNNPERTLGQLCHRLGLEFTDAMLHWPPGPRETDGVWAKHWYARLHETQGFATEREADEPLPDHCRRLLGACEELYAELAEARLSVADQSGNQ